MAKGTNQEHLGLKESATIVLKPLVILTIILFIGYAGFIYHLNTTTLNGIIVKIERSRSNLPAGRSLIPFNGFWVVAQIEGSKKEVDLYLNENHNLKTGQKVFLSQSTSFFRPLGPYSYSIKI